MKTSTALLLALAFVVFACIMSTKGALGWWIVILVMIIAVLIEIITTNRNGGWGSSHDVIYTDTSEVAKEPDLNDGLMLADLSEPKPSSKVNIDPATVEARKLGADIARKQAQVAWATVELNRKGAPVYKIGDKGALVLMDEPTIEKVIVVPVFRYDTKKGQWLPTDEIIRQGNNKAFASLLFMGYPTDSNNSEYWQEKQWALANNSTEKFLITALSPMPVEDAERFEAGQMLVGRIDTVYTTMPSYPKNLEYNLWFLNKAAADADIPCINENGIVYYFKRYFEDDLSYPVPQRPSVRSIDEMQKITPRIYDKVRGFNEHLIRVCKNGKWGFIDKKGKQITPCKYDNVCAFYKGFAQVNIGKLTGFIDEFGNEIVECIYDYVGAFEFISGLALTVYQGKFGFVSYSGEEVIPFEYDLAYGFSDGLACVMKKVNNRNKELWGYVNIKGEEVIALQYEHAVSFENGEAEVYINNYDSFIINTKGKVLRPGTGGSLDQSPF